MSWFDYTTTCQVPTHISIVGESGRSMVGTTERRAHDEMPIAPRSVEHLVLAAALADLGRWLAGVLRRLRAARPPGRHGR